jgi:hypothetical protein
MAWLLCLAVAASCRARGEHVERVAAPLVSSPEPAPEIQAMMSDRWSLELAECPIHHRSLKEDVVPVRYGRLAIDTDYRDAEELRFPNARTWYEAGCAVDEPVLARVKYCDICRSKRLDWLAEHPDFTADGVRRLTGR